MYVYIYIYIYNNIYIYIIHNHIYIYIIIVIIIIITISSSSSNIIVEAPAAPHCVGQQAEEELPDDGAAGRGLAGESDCVYSYY